VNHRQFRGTSNEITPDIPAIVLAFHRRSGTHSKAPYLGHATLQALFDAARNQIPHIFIICQENSGPDAASYYQRRLDLKLAPEDAVSIQLKNKPAIKIVSGGQTGADRAALDWAIANDLPHGGWCPRGRLAEDGIIPAFYRLKETVSTEYEVRTERNIWDSDGTVIFTIGAELSGGSRDTAAIATRLNKPWMHLSKKEAIDPVEELRLFIRKNQVKVLNVAGTRASKEPLVGEFVRNTLTKAFAEPNSSNVTASVAKDKNRA